VLSVLAARQTVAVNTYFIVPFTIVATTILVDVGNLITIALADATYISDAVIPTTSSIAFSMTFHGIC
jgi:hypothetical protein